MGRVVELNLRGSEYTPCLISIDKNTNELVAVRQGACLHPAGSERGKTYGRGDQTAEGGTTRQGGGDDLQGGEGV